MVTDGRVLPSMVAGLLTVCPAHYCNLENNGHPPGSKAAALGVEQKGACVGRCRKNCA